MTDNLVDFATAVLVPSQREQQLETVALAVAAFPSKVGTVLIKALGAAAPLTELKHLKRVRKAPDDASLLEAILCTVPSDGARDPDASEPSTDMAPRLETHGSAASLDQSCLPEPLQALYTHHGGLRLCLVRAAAAAPQTRQLWEAWTKMWPITWRIPDHGTPVTEETPVDAPTQQYFQRHMRAALQLASQADVDNAALVVDPATQALVAQAADRSAAHPLQHAVMAAVQAASERDLAQWPSDGTGADPYSSGSGVGREPVDIGNGLCGSCDGGREQSRPLQEDSSLTAAVVPRGTDAGKHRNLAESAETGTDNDAIGDELAYKRPRLGAGPLEVQTSGHSRPYMCTGYDCFVVREPCIMCAMALVHSRVQRVIYCQADGAFGALGGCRRLHACKSLNHNYEVYRMELKHGEQ